MALDKEEIKALKQDIKRIKPGKARDFAFFERGPGGDPRLLLTKTARKDAKAMLKEAGSKPIFGSVSRGDEGLTFETDKPRTLQKGLKQALGKSVPELKRAAVVKSGGAAAPPEAEAPAPPPPGPLAGEDKGSPSLGEVKPAKKKKNPKDGKEPRGEKPAKDAEGIKASPLAPPPPAPPPPPEATGFDALTAEKQREAILKAYESATAAYNKAFPSLAAELFGGGWHVNFAETMKAIVGAGDFERGCVKTQDATMAAISGLCGRPGSKWACKRIMVGAVMEHHAVALFEKGTPINKGYVLDPWKAGTHDSGKSVYTYGAWLKANLVLDKLIAGATDESSGEKIDSGD